MSTKKTHNAFYKNRVFSDYTNKSSGFTVLELVVVIGILVVIGAVIAGILYSTLRDSTKITTTNTVSQNGNYAMSVMEDIVHSSTNVADQGSDFTSAQCEANSNPSSASSIVLERVDGGMTTLLCDSSTNNIASQSAGGSTVYLLDNSVVKTSSCSFSCEQDNPYAAPIVNISFTVTGQTTSNLEEQSAAAGSGTFQTSVSMLSFSP